MKIVAIIQARMGSTRFPNKVMKPINGVPMIGLLLKRLGQSKQIQQIVIATSIDQKNDPLADYVAEQGIIAYRGSENDVLDRYYHAAKEVSADVVVRITGDCPLIDPALVDSLIEKFLESDVDYASNINPPTFPDGLDAEVFCFQALETAWREAKELPQREHVTPYISGSTKFTKTNLQNSEDYSSMRWTVDEPEDFDVISSVFNFFSPEIYFGWKDVIQLTKEHPEFFASNQHLIRNEGLTMGSGPKLWKRAKKVIPGGNLLLSKRAEMFLPDHWPAYFSKAKGCRVWDMDGRELIDMCIMGIGTNTLGYGHPEVDEAVRNTIEMGNMSTLNCPEEVYLAERLVEMHPWADMVRFARTGGEADAIAVRIARAATSRDKVAICGYHGWHDWYLSANLSSDQNLSGHLLPGLEPKGVPQELCGSTLSFHYNKFEELEQLVNQHDIGVIMMEVSRNMDPAEDFLQKIRKLATDQNIVLIFDECSSGFRQTFGGLHKLFNVEPDMAMFGKTLGNGYAINAVIGRREIMDAAQSTFISSTFWTERIGPTAALKTLEVMEREKSWEVITKIGNEMVKRWKELAAKYNLPIQVNGLPAMTTYAFDLPDALKYKTFITQEMLKKGFLASTAFYACIVHTQNEMDAYFDALDPIFAEIQNCENGKSIDDLLEGPVCHSGFKRLN